ncbi:TetR/AcrR family transcriptional regulator [Nocardia sp. alder85J]|uniref:TetR/AcrR family transcriptional regulator n=1 Tax=Nocardia sp. alder85J TaxID=2862949 RepID=UPI001CD778F7|nr:TetR/AcrR family transcriptional regulator [Nocardia sp. alder85J]MCX4098157.1 TetR family transcriptional regulator [Nocardia sp. alder85J]
MSNVKSRRELYSEATREALLDEATRLFAEKGFADTSLDEIATAGLLTRGAVYHHFASKKALFEAVLDRLGTAVVQRVVLVAAQFQEPMAAATAALDAFLTESCDPVYGKLVWQEGPLALGWEGWRRCEHEHSYALVESFVMALMESEYLERKAETTTIRLFYEMIGGAGLAIAEADPADKERVRAECSDVLLRLLAGLRRTA